jgi:hypothetical protein
VAPFVISGYLGVPKGELGTMAMRTSTRLMRESLQNKDVLSDTTATATSTSSPMSR